jgi:hypothetical protein
MMGRILLLLFLYTQVAFSQKVTIKNIVTDAKDNTPLSFVSVRIKGQPKGTLTDIEGRFILRVNLATDTLVLSLIGYESLQIVPSGQANQRPFKLSQKINDLAEVRIRPAENPAWGIIRKVLKNRPLNDPNQLDAYKANAYTKILVIADSLRKVQKDSSKKVIGTTKVSAPIYILENFSELIHKKPNKNKETIIASVNNLAQVYSQMANYLPHDLHKLTFYDDLYNFTILKRFYVSPINPKTFSQYDFNIEDTLYQERDTTFVISFKPYPKSNFDALKGTLYINSDQYAIERISVAPTDTLQNFTFRIQQEYHKVNGRWFPKTATTRLFSGYTSKGYSAMFQMRFTTYLNNIEINPDLDDKLFDEVQRAMRPAAIRQTNETFKRFRTDTLAAWEQKMYTNFKKPNSLISRLDSTYGHILASLFSNLFEIGPIELQPSDFFNGNSIEGIRLGVGVQNNQSLKPRFRLYGSVGYGLRDTRWKYKVLGNWHITKDRFNKLSAYLQNSITQPGTTEFLGPNFLIEPETSLPFSTSKDSLPIQADYFRKYGVSLHFKPFAWSWFRIAVNREQRTPNYAYTYEGRNAFEITELVLDWRFAFKENLYRTGRMESIVNRFFPIINVQVSKGLPTLGSEFDYWRIAVQIYYQIRTKRMGFSNIKVVSGFINGDLPYPYLFGSLGSSGLVNVAGLNSSGFPLATFRTLPTNAFIADRYAALYFSHDFSRTLFRFRSKYTQPRLLLYNNVLAGALRQSEKHQFSWAFRTNQLHAEAGLEIRDLLRIPIRGIFIGTGVGVAYQYFPSPQSDWKNNAQAYWLGISLSR